MEYVTGQDNLLVALKKEEDASNVLVSNSQLKEHISLIDEDRQWESVSLAHFELLDPGNDQFVKDRILLPQVLQKRENRLVSPGIVVKAYTKLHRSPAVSVCVLQHLCCIVHERTCSCKTGSS